MGEATLEPRPAARPLVDVIAGLLLVAVVLAVYAPEAAMRRSFFYLDISAMNLPARQWAFARISEGEFPLWCRHWGTGFPFVAESQTGLAYPPNYAAYPFLEGWRAYSVLLLAHLCVAALGMYVLCRQWTGPWAAVIGALAFALGGRVLAHQVHTARVELFSWFPWMLWSIERIARGGGLRYVGWTGVLGGMQVLAGALQEVLLCQMGALVFASALGYPSPKRMSRSVGGTLLAMMIALAIGAVVILPAIELLGHSVRAGGLDRPSAAWGTASPYVWVAAYLPWLFGTMAHGNAWLDGLIPWREISFYHGLWFLPLAAVGLVHGTRRAAFACLVLAATGFILALGELTPLGNGFFQLPILSSVRIPARTLLLTGTAGCVLAAAGWERLSKGGRRWGPLGTALGTMLLMAAGAGLAARQAYEGVWWGELPSGRPDDPVLVDAIARRLLDLFRAEALWTLGILVGGIVSMLLAGRAPRVASLLLFAAFAVDLGRHARAEFPTIDPAFHDEPGSTEFLKGNFDPPRVFLFNDPAGIAAPGYHFTFRPFEEIGECLYWERGPMFDVGTISSARGLPLELARWRQFIDRLGDHPYLHPLLGTELVMSPRPVRGERLDPTPIYVGKSCSIYRSKLASPYASIVPGVEWVADQAEALDRLSDPERDPRRSVVLEGAAAAVAGSDGPRPLEAHWNGPNQIRLDLEGQGAGIAVVRESFYPGWTATLDEQPAPVYPADGMFLGVIVPEGARTLVLTFRSRAFEWGLAISGLGLATAIGLIVFGGKSARTLEPRDPGIISFIAVAALVAGLVALSAARSPQAWASAAPALVEVR